MPFDFNGLRNCYCCHRQQSVMNFKTPTGTFINICHSCLEEFSLTREEERKFCAIVSTNNCRTNPAGTITFAHWVKLLNAANGCCSYCGSDVGKVNLILEHIKPLSRGGANADGNIAPACVKCNRSKRNLTLEEWRGNESVTIGETLQVSL